jgi:hypothetical protein
MDVFEKPKISETKTKKRWTERQVVFQVRQAAAGTLGMESACKMEVTE